MKFRPPPLHGRFGPLFAGLAVLLSTALGGTLQCDPQGETEAKGRHVYTLMCAVCHGANGEGYKADHAPALAQQNFLSSVSDEYLTEAITDGRWGTTMSAWGNARGGPLSRAEVDAVVLHLRSLAE
ncbi:MAG TPA: cytochrome c, partial [Polyangiaceae bacterium]